eukprot:COSAG04_NODE_1829_length_5468_cov_24.054945_3_plen_226_part_00
MKKEGEERRTPGRRASRCGDGWVRAEVDLAPERGWKRALRDAERFKWPLRFAPDQSLVQLGEGGRAASLRVRAYSGVDAPWWLRDSTQYRGVAEYYDAGEHKRVEREVTNAGVVEYSPALTVIHGCHTNVKIVSDGKMCQFLCKYRYLRTTCFKNCWPLRSATGWAAPEPHTPSRHWGLIGPRGPLALRRAAPWSPSDGHALLPSPPLLHTFSSSILFPASRTNE